MFEKLECTACAEFDLIADGPVLVSASGSNKTDPTRPDNTFLTGLTGHTHDKYAYVIPGSTIKGVIRHHMYDMMNDDEINTMFGKIGYNNGNQKGKIKFNDAYACMDTIHTAIRHNTAIDPCEQSAKPHSLRNMEVVEKGIFKASFNFKNYSSREMEKLILTLYDINTGEVRFGGQVSRGFGKMNVKNFYMKTNDGYDRELKPKNEMVFSSLNAAAEYFRKAE